MKVSEIGEFGLIELLNRIIEENRNSRHPAWKNLKVGIGDDAAAWNNADIMTLLSTDCLVQDVHFKPGQTGWKDLGWKALAVNLSDIAAMGGTAEYAVVTLGLPAETIVENITEIYKGMLDAANEFGTVIAGGDVTSSKTFFISVTVTGSAGEHILRRSAARPGDLVAVTGYPGSAAAGMKLIGSGTAATGDSPLKQAFLRPVPRLAEGRSILDEDGICAIDISDGLMADLGHICQASRVEARINTDSLPLHPAARRIFPAEALDMALGGGEDYELLFTASANVIEKVRARTSIPVTTIGEIIAGQPGIVQVMDSCGHLYKPARVGWDHFGNA
jgi:thiamine-monophosphate kinase